jgi:hypothetical protein
LRIAVINATGAIAMETNTMGRVLTEATIENLKDVWDAERHLLPSDKVRRVVVKDALVDAGARMLALPTRLIRELGLSPVGIQRVNTRARLGEASIYDAVRLTIMGRSCTMDVMEAPDDVPVRIGRLPLLALDLEVDVDSCSVTGNPAHGGRWIVEAYGVE